MSSDSVTDLLREARALLVRGGWCQHAEALDTLEEAVHPAAPAAVSWSATGAIYAAAEFDGTPERRSLFEVAVARVGDVLRASPVRWNDVPGRTKHQVLAALDAAIDEAVPARDTSADEGHGRDAGMGEAWA